MSEVVKFKIAADFKTQNDPDDGQETWPKPVDGKSKISVHPEVRTI